MVRAADPYPLRNESELPKLDGEPHPRLKTGALVFRQQCSICHTIDGVNALTHLMSGWDLEMKRQNVAKLQKLKPFMPPFARHPRRSWKDWRSNTSPGFRKGRPAIWPDSLADGKKTETLACIKLACIKKWLDEAGVEPGLKKTKEGK